MKTQAYCKAHRRYYFASDGCPYCAADEKKAINWDDNRYYVVECTHREKALEHIYLLGMTTNRRIVTIYQLAGIVHILVERSDYVHSSHRATEASGPGSDEQHS